MTTVAVAAVTTTTTDRTSKASFKSKGNCQRSDQSNPDASLGVEEVRTGKKKKERGVCLTKKAIV